MTISSRLIGALALACVACSDDVPSGPADTSGHAASTLGVYALTAVAPVAPGSPLCRAHTDDTALAGLEIALKGGQVGRPDFFCAVKRGGVE